jgi:hypothetical protein
MRRPAYSISAAVLALLASAPGTGQNLAIAEDAAPPEAVASVLEQPARLNVREAPLAFALTTLQRTSGVRIAFSPSLLATGSVSCDCLDTTVQGALDRMLRHVPFRYAVIGPHILIEPDPGVVRADLTARLADRPASGQAVASGGAAKPGAVTAVIQGRVVEAGTFRPLNGAQVTIAGMQLGTLADAEGRYRLAGVPAGDVRVRVQLIGYAAAEQSITVESGETATLDFEVRPQALDLDAIVVTGTAGQTRRREMGSSVSEFRADQVIQPV